MDADDLNDEIIEAERRLRHDVHYVDEVARMVYLTNGISPPPLSFNLAFRRQLPTELNVLQQALTVFRGNVATVESWFALPWGVHRVRFDVRGVYAGRFFFLDEVPQSVAEYLQDFCNAKLNDLPSQAKDRNARLREVADETLSELRRLVLNNDVAGVAQLTFAGLGDKRRQLQNAVNGSKTKGDNANSIVRCKCSTCEAVLFTIHQRSGFSCAPPPNHKRVEHAKHVIADLLWSAYKAERLKVLQVPVDHAPTNDTLCVFSDDVRTFTFNLKHVAESDILQRRFFQDVALRHVNAGWLRGDGPKSAGFVDVMWVPRLGQAAFVSLRAAAAAAAAAAVPAVNGEEDGDRDEGDADGDEHDE